MRECRKRHLGSTAAGNIDVLQRIPALIKPRFHFHNHVVLVQGSVHRRYLRLPKSLVQRGIDGLRADSEPRGGVTVDDDSRFEPTILLITVYVTKRRQGAHLR